VLDVVGLLRGGLDVVTAGRVVAVSGVVVTDGTVPLEVVVATFAGSDVDVDAEGKPVVDSTSMDDTVASGEFPEPNSVRPPRMSSAVTTAATVAEIHVLRVPRITSATSELEVAGSP